MILKQCKYIIVVYTNKKIRNLLLKKFPFFDTCYILDT